MTSTDTATKRGALTAKRLVVSVLAPSMVAFGVLVAVAAPASAESITPTHLTSAVFEISVPTPGVDTEVETSVLTAADVPAPSTAEPTIAYSGGTWAYTKLTRPTISGASKGVAGRTATVFIGEQTLTTIISPTGDWSVVPTALRQGVYRVTVVVRDTNGGRATAYQRLEADWTAPSIVIDGGSSRSTYSRTRLISGRTDMPAYSKINVAIDDDVQQAVVTPERTWSVTAPNLTASVHTVAASATDDAGNIGTQRQRLTVIPVLSIDGGPSVVTNSPIITGQTDAPAGTRVTLANELHHDLGSGTVTTDGTWSVKTPFTTSNGAGGYWVFATVRDGAGNPVTFKQNLLLDMLAPQLRVSLPPTVPAGTDFALGGSIDDRSPNFHGWWGSNWDAFMKDGSEVTIVVDGVASSTALLTSYQWSTTIPALAAGAHTVVVSATDVAGNVDTRTLRITAIQPITLLSLDGGASVLTKNPTPIISGKTDAPTGTVVRVTGLAQPLNTTVTAAGTWSLTAPALKSARYTLAASVGDVTGNTRTAHQALTVDLVAPSIVIDGGSAMSTKAAAPKISGRVDVPAGSKMLVVVDGVIHEVVVSSTRTWSMVSGPLKVGAHTVVVSATDAAGNVGTQRQRLTIIG